MVLYCPHCYKKYGKRVKVPVDNPRSTKIPCPECGLYVPTGMGQTAWEVKLPFFPKRDSKPKPPKDEGGEGGSRRSKTKIIERIKEKKEEAGGGVISALVVMLLVTATLVWFYFSPFNEGILEVLVIWFPNIADTWQNTYILLAAIVILALTLEALTSRKIRLGLYFVIVFWVLIFTYYIVTPFLGIFEIEVGNYWNTLICTLRMEDMQSCMGLVDGEEPEIEKEGDYVVLEAEFRTEYTGKEIYKTEIDGIKQLNFGSYFIDMEFENPSDTRAITGFNTIGCEGSQCNPGSYLKRAGSLKSVDKRIIASLEPTVECPTGGCTISPGETLRLTFKVGEIFMGDICLGTSESGCARIDFCVWDGNECKLGDDTRTTEVEAHITYEYDYSAEGKWDFIVAESDEILEPLLKNRGEPTSSAGPLDVKVVFSPTAYVDRSGIESPEVGLVVKLEKEEDGSVAFIKNPIKVSRLTDGILQKVGACTAPWDSSLPFLDEWTGEPTDDDEIDYIDLSGIGSESYEAQLRKSHTYFCNYLIDMDAIGEDGKEVIPFIARTTYRHRKIMTQRFIDVVE